MSNLYRNLIDLLSSEPVQNNNLLSQLRKSLRNHYYSELKYLIEAENWKEADIKTGQLMLYLTKREKHGFDRESINNFSCKDLKEIDSLWVKFSRERFGFSVQKHILEKKINQLDQQNQIIDQQNNRIVSFRFGIEDYLHFAKDVGWSNDDNNEELKKNSHYELQTEIPKGHFPTGKYTYYSLKAMGNDREEVRVSGNIWDGSLFWAGFSWSNSPQLPGNGVELYRRGGLSGDEWKEFYQLLIRCKL